MKESSDPAKKNEENKKAYEKPELISFGTVDKITGGFSAQQSDGITKMPS